MNVKGIIMRLFFVLLIALGVSAQDVYNAKTTSFMINNFKYDSLKTTAAFSAGDYEGLSVLIKSPIRDSAVFVVAYQRGYPDGDGNIIWKRPSMLVDTFNTLTAGNFQAAGSYVNAVGDTDLAQAIDSAQYLGYAIMTKNIQPYRAPYGRFVVKGLTGNKHTFYSLTVVAIQPKYIRVDVGTGRQPN